MNLLKKYYQVVIALLIFSSIFIFSYSFSQLIILMLEFIVVLEVVKMVDEFIRNKKIQLRNVIDSFIIFIIREIVILVSHPKKDEDTILFLSLVVLIFFVFRILAIVVSPSKFIKK